ncbi:MAG TPA: cytochrome c oxidase assembly protein [Streptosporangiaceae bacterium]
MDIQLTEQPVAAPSIRRSRSWLPAVAAALIVICLVPPLSAAARRYLFVESVQFCVFALAAPALVVLGAPWRLLRLARVADRLAAARRRRTSFATTLPALIAWVAICLSWRLPPVLDALARHPALVAPEAVTLCAAGTALWLELVPSPPLAPRVAQPQRACLAALAMWSIWVIAYVLGFASGAVVHAYDHGGSHLSTVSDQEITAFVLWAAAGAAFIPVIFAAVMGWLKDGAEPTEESAAGPLNTGVRGWGTRPARSRRRPSARGTSRPSA